MSATTTMRARRGVAADYFGMAVSLVVLILVFSLSTDHFFSAATFRTIANQIPDAVLIAVGMTYVLVIGGIDLSVGSILALAGAVLGVALVEWQLSLPVSIGLCLVVGVLCGGTNGWVTVRWRVPSFIVTLGMLEAARGAAYLVTQSQTKYLGANIDVLTETKLLGLSFPFLLALGIVAFGQFVLTRTVLGRYMVAIGTNEEAVRLSGINTGPIKLVVFAASGFLAALASVIHCARLASSNPNAGIGMELQAIAAVVIGGTSLMGGRGSVISSFFGVVIIAVLGNGLAQLGAQEPTKRVVTGLVIVAAVVLDSIRAKRV